MKEELIAGLLFLALHIGFLHTGTTVCGDKGFRMGISASISQIFKKDKQVIFCKKKLKRQKTKKVCILILSVCPTDVFLLKI